MSTPIEILTATRNAGKKRELTELLRNCGVTICGLDDAGIDFEAAETGATFAANAALKAVVYARAAKMLTLADDSGLEVAALNNAPGVFSARYGGKALPDAERSQKLLTELKKNGDNQRAARFVCVIAVAAANGEILFTANGVCAGRIAAKPIGTNGFGYDSIFIPDGREQTFGELSDEIKREISHRASAMRQVKSFLTDYLQNFS